MRKILLSGLGMGYMPVASGTWGSLLAAVLWLLAALVFPPATYGPWNAVVATLVGVVGASAICIGFGEYAIEQWKRKDPGQVVIDEVAGQWVSLLPVAFMPSGRSQILAIIAAFFLFRVMDIIKPPPARQMESWPAGIGILADDLMAGVYAAIATQVVIVLFLHG